jgi:transposase-like protein
MNEQTSKLYIDASFNRLIEVKNNGDALLTIHNDGTITAAEHLKPTETAAEVLRIMRETWMADAQSIKIRDQQEYINRLVKAGNYLDECLLSIAGENLPAKQLWTQAKEAKP